ncbi:MAG: hypothetical protein WDN01_21070 [Rhizomicrobium sp.]
MLALGFAAGLPFVLLFSTLSIWLTEAGVPLTHIGLASFIGLPSALNFAWAPLVDHVPVPFLERRFGRQPAWILLSQFFLIGGIVAMANINPATNLAAMMVAATVVSVALATQGVAIDAWRIRAAGSDDRQTVLAAPMLLGARVALLLSGAGVLYIAAAISWQAAYEIAATLMIVGMMGALSAARLTDSPAASTQDGGRAEGGLVHDVYFAVVRPFVDFVIRYRWSTILILATIGFNRLTDILLAVMANPFYLSLGFTKGELALVSQIVGISAMIVGTFVGGIVAVRMTVLRMMLLGTVLMSTVHFAYAWLATMGHSLPAITITVSLENFAGGFGGIALVAYMSRLTAKPFTATQYALLSSFIALPGQLLAGFSGYVVEAVGGFYWFFIVASLVGIPSVILTQLLIRHTARQLDILQQADTVGTPA